MKGRSVRLEVRRIVQYTWGREVRSATVERCGVPAEFGISLARPLRFSLQDLNGQGPVQAHRYRHTASLPSAGSSVVRSAPQHPPGELGHVSSAP